MRELERRQRFKKRLYSWPSLVLLAIVVGFFARGAIALMIKERDSSKEASDLEAKVKELGSREETLTAEIDKLGTRAGVEEEIKSKYNVADAGEHVAIIVDRPQKEATTTPQNGSWWSRFWDAIIQR